MTIRVMHYLPALLCALAMLGGQQVAFAGQLDSRALGDGMELFQVRPNFYVLTGAGAHVAVQVGADGAVVVDAGDAAHAERLVAEIKKLTPQPIRYIINTNAGDDHVGGNEKVAKAGKRFQLTGYTIRGEQVANSPASIVAVADVLTRMSVAGYPEGAWPTDAFVGSPNYFMYLNDEGIEVQHQPNAHSDTDSIVFFRRSDVVMARGKPERSSFRAVAVCWIKPTSSNIGTWSRSCVIALSS